MERTPRLALAVIVKDEADLLEGLLHHHRELYDEVVVVDTGSSDGSRKIAMEAGARVLDFAWVDDFATARNHGLDQVTCPWILQMDCDERISPADFPALRKIASQCPDHCVELPINNYTATSQGGEWTRTPPEFTDWAQGASGYLRTHPVRLFPNLADLRFKGVIHENLLDSVKNLDLKIERSHAIIHHTGLLESQGLVRRDELYTRLLKTKVSQNPEDLDGLTEYAKLMVSKGDLIRAEELLGQGLSRESEMGEHALANLLMVEIQARQGNLDHAINRLKPTIHKHPTHLLCWVQAAALYLADGQAGVAKVYLTQGRKLFPTSTILKQLEAKV